LLAQAVDVGDDEALSALHPAVARWVRDRYGGLTLPQRMAAVPISLGAHTLVAAPTGSGKTLAAFLPIISGLLHMHEDGKLGDSVYALYVSPLRALNNDVNKNLVAPLEEIGTIYGGMPIRVAVRTGDTPQSQRARMLRHPPHILITTPETLSIALVAPKFGQLLSTVRWVVVDEIHELSGSKRGTHLSLSLERLEERARGFVRIGLSATVHPLDEVAKFLTGYGDDGSERGCTVVDARFVKRTELRVRSPVDDPVHAPAEEVSSRMYSMLKSIIRRHRTTLVFTNTRSGAERVLYHLSKLGAADAEELATHHGSLSRDVRKDVEDRLKVGGLRAVVTSTSLELGIDIGSIDVVVQIGSPKSVSRLLQRVGRSGHSLERASRGILIAMDRDDIVEDAVMAAEALRGHLDRVHIPRRALDVLAQHLVGMSIERRWKVEDAYRVVRRSYPYRDLSMEELRDVLRYLGGGYEGLEGRKVYSKIWYDEEEGIFGRKRSIRPIYYGNVGTIPDEASITVRTKDGKWVGNLEEEFAERLSPGDVFVLGGRTFRFLKLRGATATVERAEGERPTVPSWFSELLPLSFDTAEAVGDFREEAFRRIAEGRGMISWLMEEYPVDRAAAKAIASYFEAMDGFLKLLGVVERPSRRTVLVERYVSQEGKLYVIFHAMFGRRVNDALSRAYAYMASRRLGSNVLVIPGDSGFAVVLPRRAAGGAEWLPDALGPDDLRDTLIEAVKHTEMATMRFRHCATRSLMILRSYRGRETSISRRQANSQVLRRLAERIEGFPVLRETYREILEDVMDVGNAESVLRDLRSGERRFVLMPEYDVPSPFSHGLIVSGYEDVVLMEDRKKLLEALHDSVMRKLEEAGLSGAHRESRAR
jgi:ATP-dependent Lhr-like helicase